jgi:hypothetical protein
MKRMRNGFVVRRIAAAAIAGAVACGTTSHPPSTDLTGAWNLSYDTMTTGACPTAPPGHPVGCVASGVLTLIQAEGGGLAGNVRLSGSCQSCNSVGDFAGREEPIVGSLSQSHLEFVIGEDCTFVGHATAEMVEIAGEASCPVERASTAGRWRMSRRP